MPALTIWMLFDPHFLALQFVGVLSTPIGQLNLAMLFMRYGKLFASKTSPAIGADLFNLLLLQGREVGFVMVTAIRKFHGKGSE